MKVSELRAIVFYGDITGFTGWSRRVRRAQVCDLLSTTYEIYSQWQNETGYWVKKASDGLIAVRELAAANDRNNIIAALRAGYDLTLRVNEYLSSLQYPRPPLFRWRGTLGDVWRLEESSGNVDYGGYQMDFGRRCLDIEKMEMFLITEFVFDSIGRRGCPHISIERINTEVPFLPGIEPEDQRNFYRYGFKNKARRRK